MNQERTEATTKNRILDAAEKLFAEHGFDGVSLRSIIAEAGVNLAAVHYHFHSKETLLDAVIGRRVGPLNQERMAWLDKVEAEAGDQPAPVERILEALLIPTVRLMQDPSRNGPTFCRLMGRMHSESGDQLASIFSKHIRDIAGRINRALSRSLPHLPPQELAWKVHFCMGSMAHTLRGDRNFVAVAGAPFDPSDLKAGIGRLILFLAAGLRAPVGVPTTEELENVR